MAALLLAAATPALAAESAVILAYHRFGERGTPDTNTTVAQFEAQLAELRRGGYHVLPIAEILKAIQEKKPLPDRAVGISIDVAFRSVYQVAWPRLKAAGFPFTLFIDVRPLDGKYKGYMSWDEVKALAKAGVTIGNQTLNHKRLLTLDAVARRAEIEGAAERIAAETGRKPTLFAYPYGEYDKAIRDQVAAMGFAGAFGTQGGVIYPGADRFALPRMYMNEAYGSVDRLRLVASALPLPATHILPADPVIKANPPTLGFTVDPGIEPLDRIACYAAGQGRVTLTHPAPRRVEAKLARPLPPGRWRINCTMPAGHGRWRWLGALFIVTH
ncbi:MAG: polysaccharide deacetylase family protein [Candidatus Eiseniibacteriota bacterium]